MTRDDLVAILLPVVDRLNETDISYVLVGGITVPFYLSDELATNVRPTKDVDIIVAAVRLAEFDRIEEKLRRAGFENHPEVRHRWLLEATLIDIMPVQSDLMQTINRWYPATYQTAEAIEIAPGQGALIASPACFLATKMEAFINRGRGDFLGSHDLEDIVSVIDGRDSLLDDIDRNCPHEVRDFLRVSARQLLNNERFVDAVEGHLPSEHRNEARLDRLIETIRKLGQ